MTPDASQAAHSPEASVDFENVVCGIDPSPQSREAVRQAIELGTDQARYWGVTAWDPGGALRASLGTSALMRDLREEAASALGDAQEAFPVLQPVFMRGAPVAVLLGAIANFEADLVSVGSHGTSRAAGVLYGSVATAMAHHAPCSVLVARAAEHERFPRLIVHANDGSPEAIDAARVAGRIAARHESSVVTMHVSDHANGGASVAEAAVGLIEACGREAVMRVEQGSPHRRIVEVANEVGASLLVVGARGRAGLSALGSVSERVTHNASCSVLVVRRPSRPVRDSMERRE